ncbi:hypothetical protein Acr_01g0013320 [Actinidia rufa]|uniref:Uncharacterized protein n=1 Tax=Actinidia rufa TaxID=165716 RepID=A0A7J0E4V7_9ERIC|nr:hypothetical protein Acr_01g0013320 [Actinidia rufa]
MLRLLWLLQLLEVCLHCQEWRLHLLYIRLCPRAEKESGSQRFKEAREFLSKKLIEQQPSQELEDKTEPEGAAILSLEHEKESGSNARQVLHKDIEVTGTTTLDGISDCAPAINDGNDSVLKREESVSTGKKDPEAADKGHGVNGLQMPRALLL